MKKCNWYFLFFAVLLTACSNSETRLDSPQSSNNALRGFVLNSLEGTTLPLPVVVYVFNSSDECVDMQTLQSEDEAFSFTLPTGSYSLSVISGVSAEKYMLPDVDNSTPNTPLMLKTSGDTHAELAAKTEEIVIGNNDIKNVAITVNRIIAQITASIKDVPDNITSVSIGLQPLEEEVLLNGSYGGDGNGQVSVALTKGSDDSWKTPTPVFILPGADDVSVTITLTGPDGSNTYSYATAIPIEANCKTDIAATYKAGSAEFSGNVQCSDWGNEYKVIFEFGEGASDENSGENINHEMLTQGDIYKGCYILDVLSESPEQSTFLLMAPAGVSGMRKETIPSLNKYTYLEFTNWRMQSINEAKILHAICTRGFDEFNSILNKEGIVKMVLNENYMCADSENEAYFFPINTSEFKTTAINATDTYSARLVKEVTVKWESENGE